MATFGPEIGELMARAGKPLDRWQQDAEDLILAVGEDGRWACYEYAEIVSRQNGKGGILEGRALGGLLLLGEELIMWSAHEYKTAMEAFRRCRALLWALGTALNDNLINVDGVLVKISNTNGEESFERLDTGARLKFIARSKSSGRGFSGDVNIIDEAFAYTAEQHEALLFTLSARPNPQIIYTSSPPLDGNSGEILFDLRDRAESGADDEDALGYRDWGLAGDLDHLDVIDLDDRELWARTNPALGRRLRVQTLVRERRSMKANGGSGFARERLGVWPYRARNAGGAIDIDRWAQLLDTESRRVGDVALAVDIAPQRDHAAIGLYGVRADGAGHVQLLDYRPGTAWLVDRIVELRGVLNPVAIGMGRGTAASLETDLAERGIRVPDDEQAPARGDLAVLSALDMSAACGQLLDAVRERTVRHVGQEPLDIAVAGARTRQNGDTIAWSRREPRARRGAGRGDATDIAPLVAVTIARWALRTRPSGDYDPLDNIW